jgi:energy-coupling factor transport system ATP-binding protein
LQTIIEVTDLTYLYRSGSGSNVLALNGVNMQVYRGEILAITGQNGSGKSTLARHFNALLTPRSGSVIVDGLSVADKKNTAAIRRSVGMVFQNPDNQLVSSVVEEDIAFGPENLGVPQAEIIDRVDWALKSLNLEAYRHRSPNSLSEGQKQLVAIAGVLAMKPKCIVLDEPTAHLDPKGKREVLENVLRLNKEEGITTILLTHFMNEVVHCDRMIIMDQGEVKMTGTPRDLFKQADQIKALGLDLPPASQLAHGLNLKGLALPDNILTIEELVDSICQLP